MIRRGTEQVTSLACDYPPAPSGSSPVNLNTCGRRNDISVCRIAAGTLCVTFSVLLSLCIAATDAGLAVSAQTPGISNRARAGYKDEGRADYQADSPTVNTNGSSTGAAIMVTPDDTQPSAQTMPNTRITRFFRVCNTGGAADSFTLTRAVISAPATIDSLYLDRDESGTLTAGDIQISLNTPVSPALAPGGCGSVLLLADTGNVATGSSITIGITAKSSQGGAPQDDGTIINAVGGGAVMTDPARPSLPPQMLVDNGTSANPAPGSVLTFSVGFRNHSTVAARKVRLSNDLPAELDYQSGTLLLSKRALTDAVDDDEGQVSGKRIEVLLAQVAPGEMVTFSFQARLNALAIPGVGIINTATISAENIDSPIRTTEAVTVIGTPGVVYAGYSGGSVRIGGATLVLTSDQAGANPVTLTGGRIDPNAVEPNPLVTNAQGHFSFPLSGIQNGSAGNTVTWYLHVQAQGYRPRVIELTIRANAGGLFDVVMRSLDGQPLAPGGSFTLTESGVSLDNLAVLAINIPLFEMAVFELTKTADRQQVEIGGMVTYTVTAHNATSVALDDFTLTDTLPSSFSYVNDTARMQQGSGSQISIRPMITGSLMTIRIGRVGAGEKVRVSYRLRVGANARAGQQVNLAVGSGTFPGGLRVTTPPAKAPVLVGAGIFSMRQVIIGRVFEDTSGNGLFDKGERPIAGARVYLNNGQSVITDSKGLFNFPTVEDGATVVSLDPITVPNGFALHDNDLKSGRSWTRLLRTPLGGGSLLRVNFGLQKVSNAITDMMTDIDMSGTVAVTHPGNGNTNTPVPETAESPGSTGTGRKPKAGDSLIGSGEMRKPGTYKYVMTDRIDPIAPGDLRVLAPSQDEVVMDAALKVEAQVALHYSVRLEVDGKQIPETNIGAEGADHKNRIRTIVYVGVTLKPGPNSLKITAVAPDGTTGRSVSMSVMGRGPARRLVIVPDKKEIVSGGRDSTLIRVKAYDEWGNPALSGQVSVEVTAGRLQRPRDEQDAASRDDSELTVPVAARGVEATAGLAGEGIGANYRQQVVTIENGEGVVQLIGEGAPGNADIIARTGEVHTIGSFRIAPEARPRLLVGLAEATFGKSAPENALRNEDRQFRSQAALYFRGPTLGRMLLTLAYNSSRPLTRTAGRERMFFLDPLDRVYPLFGDDSTRFEDAQSNSKLYARIDRGRSYAMFGDFDVNSDTAGSATQQQRQNLSENLAGSAIGRNGLGVNYSSFSNAGPQLTGYARRLTGIKLHLENDRGDFLTATGARPVTAFARDIIPGGSLSLLRLSHTELLQGSETVVLEVRDRRNPEIILSRENLVRSVDYNLDSDTGMLWLLRPVSTFDYALNLVQLVVTYEYRAVGMSTAVYTARGSRAFHNAGLRVGASFVNQRQDQFGSFYLGGVDLEQKLPRNGALQFEWGMSDGRAAASGNLIFSGSGNALSQERNGQAIRADLRQPLPFSDGLFQASFARSAARFLNPFGATVTPGSQRLSFALDLKPLAGSVLRVGFSDERNKTETFDNQRQTVSTGLVTKVSEQLRLSLGYDFRRFVDRSGSVLPGQNAERERASHLLTLGAEYRPTDRLQLAVKREQNLTESDPSYPTQTTIAAGYRLSSLAKVFFTQRLAANAITPISDLSATGFAAMASRREMALGVETSLGRYTSLNSRYQIENGINGADSFAIIGLNNRLPLRKNLSLDLGYERGMHLTGRGQSFNNASIGFSFLPTADFRTTARYELRDQNGFGNSFTFGAAGKICENLTALGRWQYARTDFDGRGNRAFGATAALAWRPLESDRTALLFSYTRRSSTNRTDKADAPTHERDDTLATDGLYQPTRRLELYGRFALRLGENGRADIPAASTMTMMGQGRAEFRFAKFFDLAGEGRSLWQPASGTRRNSFGAELGMWVLPDLRLAAGYNFAQAVEPGGTPGFAPRRGFYVAVSTKLSQIFNLTGTARDGLVAPDDAQTQAYLTAGIGRDEKIAAALDSRPANAPAPGPDERAAPMSNSTTEKARADAKKTPVSKPARTKAGAEAVEVPENPTADSATANADNAQSLIAPVSAVAASSAAAKAAQEQQKAKPSRRISAPVRLAALAWPVGGAGQAGAKGRVRNKHQQSRNCSSSGGRRQSADCPGR